MEELVPSEFYLSQNSPNPFSGRTKIKYCLPVKAKVNLILFDSNFDKVNELVSKIEEAGTYEIEFDSRDFPDGIYHYQLKVVDPELFQPFGQKESKQIFISTRKMEIMSIKNSHKTFNEVDK